MAVCVSMEIIHECVCAHLYVSVSETYKVPICVYVAVCLCVYVSVCLRVSSTVCIPMRVCVGVRVGEGTGVESYDM